MAEQTSAKDSFFSQFNFSTIFTQERLLKLGETLIAIVVFYLVYRIAKYYINKFARKKIKQEKLELIDKAVRYVFNIFITLYILKILGININAILGAAGILGVAIGFAAQTSMSNIISGFFILAEHSLKIGDFISIDDISGTVHSINLLSVKLVTLDNQMVRIPNESIIKANVVDSTFHHLRRLQIPVGVAYDSDLQQVTETLLGLTKKVPLVLQDPPPLVMMDSFADSAVNVILAVWFKKDDYTNVKNAIIMEVHRTFKEEGISIAFPQLDVHVDSAAGENGHS
ncbi:mechanosensitive ion channel family protein [Brucepastera parasyntrophica]|uniref:mechanosensitive ion channel family protein n=1 Tax=Brucepastera parasyntrophica TaxID=2880008 RepID=UPI00210D8021|nr:mechanosensitive ion channel family protein [Brucepastera parasyntrophica]ULQ59255.1 mechanosensitive ion channel family protein [Brucepastera parasyntrophica]